MVIAGKITATLNLSTQDGPIIIFPIEQMSRFQAQAYGNQWGLSASMNQSYDWAQKD